MTRKSLAVTMKFVNYSRKITMFYVTLFPITVITSTHSVIFLLFILINILVTFKLIKRLKKK